LRGIRSKADKLGTLAIVGNGTVAHAVDFARTHGKGLRSLVDTDRETYRALNFHRGIMRTLSPAAAGATLRATAHGFVQGTTQGAATQMGGSLVGAPGGRPVYFQRSDFPGDHPSLEVLLEALRAARAPKEPPTR